MVRPGIVWGSARGTLGVMADDIAEGRGVPVIGSADMRWPLVHRDDLAALNVATPDHGVADAAYHGVTEAGLRVDDVLVDIGAMVGRPARHRIIPIEQALAERGAWIAGEARSQVMDRTRTSKDLRRRLVRFRAQSMRRARTDRPLQAFALGRD